jgi:hypothetical protein
MLFENLRITVNMFMYSGRLSGYFQYPVSGRISCSRIWYPTGYRIFKQAGLSGQPNNRCIPMFKSHSEHQGSGVLTVKTEYCSIMPLINAGYRKVKLALCYSTWFVSQS